MVPEHSRHHQAGTFGAKAVEEYMAATEPTKEPEIGPKVNPLAPGATAHEA